MNASIQTILDIGPMGAERPGRRSKQRDLRDVHRVLWDLQGRGGRADSKGPVHKAPGLPWGVVLASCVSGMQSQILQRNNSTFSSHGEEKRVCGVAVRGVLLTEGARTSHFEEQVEGKEDAWPMP